jgi:hypothetical protein
LSNLTPPVSGDGHDAPAVNEAIQAQFQELQQKIAELEGRLNPSSKGAPPGAPDGGAADATAITIDDSAEGPAKSTRSCCTLWGGPIMPSEDQNLW